MFFLHSHIYTITPPNISQADNLLGSGLESVSSTTLYAIIGAIALERGGEVANKITQDKILEPLGFAFSES
jgi:large subunit ribosomal protein L15